MTPEASPPVNIENLHRNELISDSSLESDMLLWSCKRCCFICFYAICFSILKELRYWNETTLDAIIENSSQLHENMMLKEHCIVSDLPNSLAIDVANAEALFSVWELGYSLEINVPVCFYQQNTNHLEINQRGSLGKSIVT